MSIFGTILSKFGLGDGDAPLKPLLFLTKHAAANITTEAPTEAAAAELLLLLTAIALPTSKPSSAHDEDLNWQVSIVDPMKLLSIGRLA